MSQPIPWKEWEAEASILHRELQENGIPLKLSGAQRLIARMMGKAHWHELEQGWKRPPRDLNLRTTNELL